MGLLSIRKRQFGRENLLVIEERFAFHTIYKLKLRLCHPIRSVYGCTSLSVVDEIQQPKVRTAPLLDSRS